MKIKNIIENTFMFSLFKNNKIRTSKRFPFSISFS